LRRALSQAFLNRAVPIKRYVGVDAYGGMIDYLQANVADPRLEYVHVNAHTISTTRHGEIM